MHVPGRSWVSRSQAVAVDRAGHRFAYRPRTDDGNPSWSDWEWRVSAIADGSAVTVTVDLNPVTFWRKRLLIHVRRPGLRRELRDSLRALAEHIV